MTIVLMLKAPVPGFCKTRLARELDDPAQAARVYRAIVEGQMRQIPESQHRIVAFAPPHAEHTMRSWLGDSSAYIPQVEGDLGDRLIAAMFYAFEAHSGPVLFLGGDCPYFLTRHFLETAKRLLTHDVVIVPAHDGGYCMIATRINTPTIFQSITWSTSSVLEETLAQCATAGLSVSQMDPMEDVDDLASLERARSAGVLPAV